MEKKLPDRERRIWLVPDGKKRDFHVLSVADTSFLIICEFLQCIVCFTIFVSYQFMCQYHRETGLLLQRKASGRGIGEHFFQISTASMRRRGRPYHLEAADDHCVIPLFHCPSLRNPLDCNTSDVYACCLGPRGRRRSQWFGRRSTSTTSSNLIIKDRSHERQPIVWFFPLLEAETESSFSFSHPYFSPSFHSLPHRAMITDAFDRMPEQKRIRCDEIRQEIPVLHSLSLSLLVSLSQTTDESSDDTSSLLDKYWLSLSSYSLLLITSVAHNFLAKGQVNLQTVPVSR